MDYRKLFGFGALIWVVAYLVASIFVVYKVIDTLLAQLVILLAVAVVAYLAGRNLKLDLLGGLLKYSVVWLVIALVLDMIFTVPFTGWQDLYSWHFLVGYALILLVPLLACCCCKQPETPAPNPPRA